jgi:hypothetical protein
VMDVDDIQRYVVAGNKSKLVYLHPRSAAGSAYGVQRCRHYIPLAHVRVPSCMPAAKACAYEAVVQCRNILSFCS